MTQTSSFSWGVAAAAAAAVIGLLAFARGVPGADDRVPEYDGPAIVVVTDGE